MIFGLLGTDPNWERNGLHAGITRRFILSMALMSVGLVVLFLPLAVLVLQIVVPVPFQYRNLPFRVCGPGTTTVACAAYDPDTEVFHSGDVVPFVVDRCAMDFFATSTQLPYVVSRNVVNDETGTRVILSSLSTEAPSGACDTSITLAHQLPDALPPGRYYIEGVATAFGRFRTVNAYFRTETFTVAPKDP